MVGEEITLWMPEIELLNLILYWKISFYFLPTKLLNGVKNPSPMLLVNPSNGQLKPPLVLMKLKSLSEIQKKELVIPWPLMINIYSKEKFLTKINSRLKVSLLIMLMVQLFLDLTVKTLILVIVLMFGQESMLLKLKKPKKNQPLMKMKMDLMLPKIWVVVTVSKEEDVKMVLIPIIVFIPHQMLMELTNVQELIIWLKSLKLSFVKSKEININV